MNIAVVGAGFAGLAVGLRLIRMGAQVTVFEDGRGASEVATGLMHPYPGAAGRRSWRAGEAMEASLELMGEEVILSRGAIRHVEGWEGYGEDVEKVGEGVYYIRSAVTVDVKRYLEKLRGLCEGVRWVKKRVGSLQELKEFDRVIVCAGAGVIDLCPGVPLALVKGQMLICERAEGLKEAIIGKGHVTLDGDLRYCQIGSTYERGKVDGEPDLEKAKEILLPRVAGFYPKELKVVECRSAFRVARQGSYVPLIRQIDERTTLLSGMGSRGLLYHAYLSHFVTSVEGGRSSS